VSSLAVTPFERLGGEPALRRIIDHFVDRLFDDVMIGFFFARASRERIKEKEFEHAAALLGGPHVYGGRPLPEAHARHPIQGGHFMRRVQILREVLAEFEVPAEVSELWLEHTLSLRGAVTPDRGSECDGREALARLARGPEKP
jgi:hemoglobin